MVLALVRPEAEESQSEFSSGFLTQKELDPDFVDFNSVNRRYHFPARFYLPFRGGFGQVDPLNRLRIAVGSATDILRNPYRFTSSRPTVHVDPTGLQDEGLKPLKECVECFELIDELITAMVECEEMLGGPPQRSLSQYASCVLAKISTKLDKLKECWGCIEAILEFIKELLKELYELLKKLIQAIKDLWKWIWTSATKPHWVYMDPSIPPPVEPYPGGEWPTEKKRSCCINYCPPKVLEVWSDEWCPKGYSHRYPVACKDVPFNLSPQYPGLKPSD
jgi:hypothetical protein